jgi:hypothetical protein
MKILCMVVDFVNGGRFCKIYLDFVKSAKNFQNVPIC